MRVYRVESIFGGGGPFVAAFRSLYDDAAVRAAREGRERVPLEVSRASVKVQRSGIDHQLPVTVDHLFGCDSRDMLRLWFPSPSGCVALAESGAAMAVYEVPEEHVLFGPAEVAFDQRFAEHLGWESLRDLHGMSPRPGTGSEVGIRGSVMTPLSD